MRPRTQRLDDPSSVELESVALDRHLGWLAECARKGTRCRKYSFSKTDQQPQLLSTSRFAQCDCFSSSGTLTRLFSAAARASSTTRATGASKCKSAGSGFLSTVVGGWTAEASPSRPTLSAGAALGAMSTRSEVEEEHKLRTRNRQGLSPKSRVRRTEHRSRNETGLGPAACQPSLYQGSICPSSPCSSKKPGQRRAHQFAANPSNGLQTGCRSTRVLWQCATHALTHQRGTDDQVSLAIHDRRPLAN